MKLLSVVSASLLLASSLAWAQVDYDEIDSRDLVDTPFERDLEDEFDARDVDYYDYDARDVDLDYYDARDYDDGAELDLRSAILEDFTTREIVKELGERIKAKKASKAIEEDGVSTVRKGSKKRKALLNPDGTKRKRRRSRRKGAKGKKGLRTKKSKKAKAAAAAAAESGDAEPKKPKSKKPKSKKAKLAAESVEAPAEGKKATKEKVEEPAKAAAAEAKPAAEQKPLKKAD